MEGFEHNEFTNYIKALFAVAWADRELQQVEKDLLAELIEHHDIDETLKKEIYGYFESPVLINDVDFTQLSLEAKEYILQGAWIMAMSDKKLDTREDKILKEMMELMNLPENTLEMIKKGRKRLTF